METLRDLDIVRAVPAEDACQFRALTEDAERTDSLGTLDVFFSPFNTFYRIQSFFEGDFMERTVRGAFSKTIAESIATIKVQYDHGQDPSIGSKILGEIITLEEQVRGPLGVVDLFDTSYNRDLLPGLKRGAYGSSFRFRVIKDEWNDEPERSASNPDGIPERTIKEVRLLEFGPVAFGANPAATSGVRSMTDDYHERLRARDPQGYDDLRAQARALHQPGAAASTPTDSTPEPDPAAASTETERAAAPEPTDEPTSGHSGGYSARERRALIHPFLKEASQ